MRTMRATIALVSSMFLFLFMFSGRLACPSASRRESPTPCEGEARREGVADCLNPPLQLFYPKDGGLDGKIPIP